MPRLNLDVEHFLSHIWQRQPLFIPAAIDDFITPLPADELAGLALEDQVESRLVSHRNNQWHLQHGPMAATDFQRDDTWTLLVQAVDHYVPAAAELRELVRFLPQWRVDDVMASYAVDGGSVGPHYDNYDVFLLQGEGQRLWRIGQHCDENSPLLDHPELRILSDFDCQQEFLLNPGDILYLPPGVAHWGLAVGECTTFSIGFRAPRSQELVSRWADHYLEHAGAGTFFSDPGRTAAKHSGEISAQDKATVLALLVEQMRSTDGWLGELLTEPKYDLELISPEDVQASLQAITAEDVRLVLAPESKLAWEQHGNGLCVFANGLSEPVQSELKLLVVQLCEHQQWSSSQLQEVMNTDDGLALIRHLISSGTCYVD